MNELSYYDKLLKELMYDDISNERILEIRQDILNHLFSYGDASVFDEMVEWNQAVKKKLNHKNKNIVLPGNKGELGFIANAIHRLDNQDKP